jgi:hypothetical protein
MATIAIELSSFLLAKLDMRIGEVAQATGVPAATLRAWERRYGVLRPDRTPGGHRVYSPADVARVNALLAIMAGGRSVSVAAAELGGHSAAAAGPDGDAELAREAWESVDRFDEAGLRGVLALAVSRYGVGSALDAVAVPLLRRLGSEWRQSPRNIAREHFASTIVRAAGVELVGLGGGRGRAPRCVSFCPEGELHDLGTVMAAASIAAVGWRSIVLGAHTPLSSVDAILEELRPSVVLIGAQRRPPAARLAARWTPPAAALVVLGGAGFGPGDAARLPGAVVHHGGYAALPAAVSG